MEHIYIIVENGEAYPDAYKNYKSAVNAVKEKHREYLQEQINELYHLDMIESVLADVNVPENIETGISRLYIEKGINIEIYKLPIQGNTSYIFSAKSDNTSKLSS
jgi:hypothetical protein